ncbi:hypothetical protein B0H19DRAFT_615376 [Mycena capillaripes]|nr:hypothetical protein B0H19DRAFT_615376 [Mycena capillaripes]
MLATLRFLPLLGLPLTYAATNIINASDPSLSFSPGWTEEFSQATQDLFSQTDVFGGSLTVTLPSAASSVSYIAFSRAGGSVYGYTLDCEDDCVLQTVNGSDPSVTDDASVFPSTIFSVDLDPSTQHTLRVYNIPSDQPDGSSEITFNSLSVDVQDNIVPTPGSLPGISAQPSVDEMMFTDTNQVSHNHQIHLKPSLTVPPRLHCLQHPLSALHHFLPQHHSL